MPESVAVQMFADHVLLARAEDSADGPALSALVHRPVTEDESAVDVAARLVREHGIEDQGLALAIGWDQYAIRDAWLPFTTEAHIRATIKGELEDDLDRPGDDMLMPFQLVEERPDAGHVLAWALPKATLRGIMNSWESAGIAPEYVGPDAMGHAGLVEALAADLAEQSVVAISGDEHTVHLTLLVGRRVWAHRRLLGFSWATDAAGRPLQEVRRTFLSVPGFPPPAAVVSFGGEPADTLAGVVANDLGVAHRPVARPAVETDGPPAMAWPLAAGVALMMARGNGDLPLSFRVEEFEPKETAGVVSMLSWVTVALLGIVLLLGGFMLQLSAQSAAAKSARVEMAYQDYWKKMHLPTAQRPGIGALDDTLRQRITQMQRTIEQARKSPNALRTFARVAERMGALPQQLQIELSDIGIDVRSDSVRLSATAKNLADPKKSYEAVTTLSGHISQSPGLEATVTSAETSGNDLTRFEMRITATQ